MKISEYVALIIVALAALIPLCLNASDKEMYWRLRSTDSNLSSAERLEIIDSLINRCPEMSDSLLFLSADLAYNAGFYGRSLHSLEKLEHGYALNNSVPISKKCKLLFLLARANMKCHHKGKGIDNLMKLLYLRKPDSLLYYDVDGLCMLNDIYSSYRSVSGDYNIPTQDSLISKAQKIIDRAVDVGITGYPLIEMKKTLLFSKMSYAIDGKDYRKALEYGSEILNYPVNNIEKLALEGNMAMIYYYMEEFDLAKEYYEKIVASSAWHSNHGVCLSNYMRLLLSEGRYDDVLDMMASHPDIVGGLSGGTIYADMLYTRALAYYGMGNYEKAYDDMLESRQVSDSLMTNVEREYASLLFDNLNAFYSIKNDSIDNNVSRKDIFKVLVVSGLILLLMGISCIIYIRRLKREMKASEASTAEEGDEEQPDNAGDDIVKCGMEKDSVVRTLHHASLNETVGNISSILQDSSMNDAEKLTNITSQIREFTSYDDLWDIFHLQFEKLNPDFFSRLKGKYNDLTQGEMRMCAYVFLNMSNKEIAALTRRSIRSVETMRYRLTKKMNLSSGETLSTHLHTL